MRQVIKRLEAGGCIGGTLGLLCSNHPEEATMVASAADFDVLAPDGGCSRQCTSPLPCGHACPRCFFAAKTSGTVMPTHALVRRGSRLPAWGSGAARRWNIIFGSCTDLLHCCCRSCHVDDPEHRRATCHKPCRRLHACGHACTLECSQPCGVCNEVVAAVQLPCGHTATQVPCHR